MQRASRSSPSPAQLAVRHGHGFTDMEASLSDVLVMGLEESQELQSLLRNEETSLPGLKEDCCEKQVRNSGPTTPELFMETAFE